jgi:hypothetical protein
MLYYTYNGVPPENVYKQIEIELYIRRSGISV